MDYAIILHTPHKKIARWNGNNLIFNDVVVGIQSDVEGASVLIVRGVISYADIPLMGILRIQIEIAKLSVIEVIEGWKSVDIFVKCTQVKILLPPWLPGYSQCR